MRDKLVNMYKMLTSITHNYLGISNLGETVVRIFLSGPTSETVPSPFIAPWFGLGIVVCIPSSAYFCVLDLGGGPPKSGSRA